ncbi:MAG: DUF167 domain-containing protein [Bdellovibrionota bacterium]|mgnify:FL=1
MSKAVEATANGVRLIVHAQPGAKRTEFAGLHGEAVKIRVHAPPVEGKANEELIRFLADAFGLARSKVILVRGEKSRSKTFELRGVDAAFVLSHLA